MILAPGILDTEKSHSQAGEARKTRGSKAHEHETNGAGCTSSLKASEPGVKRAGRDEYLSSISQEKRAHLSFLHVMGLFTAHPSWGQQSTLLSPPIQMQISLETRLQTYLEMMLNQISGNPMIQSLCHIKINYLSQIGNAS